MTLTAGPILETARDRHVTFNRRHHPDPVLLRELTSYVRTLSGLVSRIDETLLAEEETVALPLFDFEAGMSIPANRTIVGVVLKDAQGGKLDVDVIPWANRFDRNRPRLAAWEVAGSVYLSGQASTYVNYTEVGLLVIPIAAPFAALTDTIPLPDTVEECLTTHLAMYMAKRGTTEEGVDKPDPRSFTNDAAEAEVRFLAEVGNRVAGRSFRVRDVFPR
jgi:hypothetical protein